VELGKKSIKKNRFKITAPVEVYKSEFVSNANLTFIRNILNTTNLFNIDKVSTNNYSSPTVSDDLLYSNNHLNLVSTFLKTSESEFLMNDKSRLSKKSFLFAGSMNGKLLKQNLLKKSQPIGTKRQKVVLKTNSAVELVET